jgi:hypothetical protein
MSEFHAITKAFLQKTFPQYLIGQNDSLQDGAIILYVPIPYANADLVRWVASVQMFGHKIEVWDGRTNSLLR